MNGTSTDSQLIADDQDDNPTIKFEEWGFKVDRLFEVAYRFYKRNESKAFYPSFDVRNHMTALILQARYGDHDNGKAPDIGVLDFVGKRRQYEWSLLKGMSKMEAMSKFICNLDEMCPIFRAHAEAIKVSSGMGQLNGNKSISKNQQNQSGSSSEQPSEEKEQLKAIYTSLCRQTHDQFKGYAKKQFPNDLTEQKNLIRSLQEQYFQQYITQMHPELRRHLDIEKGDSQDGGLNLNNSLLVSNTSTTEVKSSGDNTSDTIPSDSIGNGAIEAKISVLVSQSKSIQLNDNVTKFSGTATEPTIQKKIPNLTNGTKQIEDDHLVAIVETDISCEELNTSDITYADDQKRVDVRDAYQSGPDVSTTLDIPTVSEVTQSAKNKSLIETSPQIQSHVEHVRLYQNNDLPPIGPFESFPEPKPIQSNIQKSRALTENLDPNLKSQPLPITGQTVEEAKIIDPVVRSIENHDLVQQKLLSSMDNTLQSPESSCPSTSPRVSSNLQQSQFKLEFDSRDDLLNKGQLPDLPPLPQFTLGTPIQEIPNEFQAQNLVSQNHQHTHTVADDTCAYGKSEQATMSATGPIEQPYESSSDNWTTKANFESATNEIYNGINVALSNSVCEAASTWSKRGVAEFKDSLDGDKYGGVYEVKEGTVVVIQVPTYPDGRYIYFEFATDDYDIGFGLEFVYETNLIEPLALHIYEESDDDENDEDDGVLADYVNGGSYQTVNHLDPENQLPLVTVNTGSNVAHKKGLMSAKSRRLANTISILPTYRRDSHEEIFVGRHKYPSCGYYLLRFDNTYSVLRSKTLYFRICYFV